jgi:hypothetical protein
MAGGIDAPIRKAVSQVEDEEIAPEDPLESTLTLLPHPRERAFFRAAKAVILYDRWFSPNPLIAARGAMRK